MRTQVPTNMASVGDIISVRKFSVSFLFAVFVCVTPLWMGFYYAKIVTTAQTVLLYAILSTIGVSVLVFYIGKIVVLRQFGDPDD